MATIASSAHQTGLTASKKAQLASSKAVLRSRLYMGNLSLGRPVLSPGHGKDSSMTSTLL